MIKPCTSSYEELLKRWVGVCVCVCELALGFRVLGL